MSLEYNKIPNETELHEILHKITGSAVGIQIIHSRDEIDRCSGVHIGGGLILTVHHAIDSSDIPGRIIVGYNEAQWDASVVEAVDGLDLLLLQLNHFDNNLQVAEVHNENVDYVFQPGERLIYSPYFPQRRVLAGRFVVKDPGIEYAEEVNPNPDPYTRFPQYDFVISTQIPPVPGNSGSGVFNLRGELVGTIRVGSQALDMKHNAQFPIALAVSSKALGEFAR